MELEALLKLIDELVAAGEEVTVADRDGYSPRTQMVLDRAREMADRFDSERIGTEHLLLAIIKEGDCAASRLLNTMGANPQKLLWIFLLRWERTRHSTGKKSSVEEMRRQHLPLRSISIPAI